MILLAILSAVPVQAADGTSVTATGGASMALARYTAGLEHSNSWGVETVEIEAALPRLKKAGRLRAIRRLLPGGKPEYQVLEVGGDKTVKQQVIVRYLSADATAAAMPPSSVAITPENYHFRYKGVTQAGGSSAYVFLISPRQKRDGLIKGELWLDGETGTAVRQSGYFVKSPSLFVKRVALTRNIVLLDGIAAERVTYLSVQTRLLGLAELTIRERPFLSVDPAGERSIPRKWYSKTTNTGDSLSLCFRLTLQSDALEAQDVSGGSGCRSYSTPFPVDEPESVY